MRVSSQHTQSFATIQVKQQILQMNVTMEYLNNFTKLYREDLKDASDAEVGKVTTAQFLCMTVTQNDAEAIARATGSQSSCLEWHEQRCGRMTASSFYKVW